MLLSPRLRRALLALHVLVSVGWIGAVVAYLVLDIAVSAGSDASTLRAAYIAMGLTTAYAIVPLAVATLVTGIVLSLGTRWGLFRHYWVVISLIMTLGAFVILLIEAQTVYALAATARDTATTDAMLLAMPGTLLHSIGGTVVLVVVMVLNIYKPRGLTRYGWRKMQEAHGRP